jgi:GalNAc-alpha-(1->4)-GalNAc-alpha-(1->3)-diNAcBac-PP-undecaprenol alpha-1,4-N-acetyl-D-galactosaminyltransferase
MRILLIISSLHPGGAERVLSTLANEWSISGHDVHLVTIDNNDADFYKLHDNVFRHSLGLAGNSSRIFSGVIANINRISKLRRICHSINPDVVLSFVDSTNILMSIALIGTSVPLVVSERIDPFKNSIEMGMLRDLIRPYLYRHSANTLVVQTDAVEKKCATRWKLNNVKTIANPIWVNDDASCHTKEKIILSVGRLHFQKGHDVLIKAFKKVYADFPEWRLIIYGEGELRNSLESELVASDLTEVVSLRGAVKDIFPIYQAASIFVMPSRFEGFPNALLEALAMGCACISTDCESGPREILEGGRLGMLTPVDDVEAMANALRSLMQSPALREQFGSHAAYVIQRYHLDKISQQWLDLFESVQK